MQQPHANSPIPGPAGAGKPATPAVGAVTDGSALHTAPTLSPPGVSTHERNALAGMTFGDFELLAELGRGGMGVVYKARQTSLDRFVAVKLLLAEHTSNAALLTRFLAEAKAAAGLAHPNIVSVYAVGECAAGPYFVMEFLDGPSLEVLIGRSLPVAWTVSLLATVAEAVHHAHTKNVIHRDLKPGNILLHLQKRPVVTDFGIAKTLGRGTGLTAPGAIVGTPAYMPPEQAGEEACKIGPHSDVYSLGAILYTLLTGQVPYDEGTALKTILRVIAPEPPPAVRSLRPDVPGKLEQIVMRCLEKDFTRRYPTAHALAEELRRFKASLTKSSSSLRAAVPTVLLTSRGGKQVRLDQAATVIGRSAECDLVVKAPDVSKRHCRVLITPEAVYVEDLGSVNGTFVNGEQIDKRQLRDGDKIDLAGHVFQVQLQRPGGA